jgi:hypothetical protein
LHPLYTLPLPFCILSHVDPFRQSLTTRTPHRRALAWHAPHKSTCLLLLDGLGGAPWFLQQQGPLIAEPLYDICTSQEHVPLPVDITVKAQDWINQTWAMWSNLKLCLLHRLISNKQWLLICEQSWHLVLGIPLAQMLPIHTKTLVERLPQGKIQQPPSIVSEISPLPKKLKMTSGNLTYTRSGEALSLRAVICFFYHPIINLY